MESHGNYFGGLILRMGMIGHHFKMKMMFLEVLLSYWVTVKATLHEWMYSRTSMAQTRRDRRFEFNPSMGSRDTWSDSFQGSSLVLDYRFLSMKVAKCMRHLPFMSIYSFAC